MSPARVNGETAGLILVLLFFLSAQLFLIHHDSVWSDEALYAWNAQLIHDNPSAVFSAELWEHQPPLFSFLASFLIGPFTPLLSVRIVSILFGLVSIALVYFILHHLGFRKMALVGAALLATRAPFFAYTFFGLLETALVTGVLLTFYGLVRFAEKGNVHWIVIGSIISLLSKRAGIVAPMVGILGVAFILLWDKENKKNQKSFTNIRVGHDLILILFLVGAAALSFLVFRPSFPFLNPAIFIQNILTAAPLFPAYFFPLFLGGYIHGVKAKSIPIILAAGVFILFVTNPFLELTSDRYALAGLPFFILVTVVGLVWGQKMKWVQRIPGNRFWIMAFVGVVCVAGAVESVDWVGNYTLYTGYQETGAWLKENAQDGVILDMHGREIRLFSGIELSENGGAIHAYPHTEAGFVSFVEKSTVPVYAIFSIWADINDPPYISEEFFVQQGFVPLFSVQKNRNGSIGRVATIYKYEK